MTGRWWECKICAEDLGVFGEQVMVHRERTGHVGAVLFHGERRAMETAPRRGSHPPTRYTADGDPL